MSEQSGISEQLEEQLESNAEQVAQDPNPFGPPPAIFSPFALKRQSNPAAKYGLILAFVVWPVGLVVSVIALVRSRSRGGAGAMSGAWGVLVSVGLGIVTMVILTTGPAAVVDPGCPTAKSALTGINTATAAITPQNENDPSALLAQLQPLQTELDQAEALTTHPAVHDAIQQADTDAQGLILALKAQLNGATGAVNIGQQGVREENLITDGGNLDRVCAN